MNQKIKNPENEEKTLSAKTKNKVELAKNFIERFYLYLKIWLIN